VFALVLEPAAPAVPSHCPKNQEDSGAALRPRTDFCQFTMANMCELGEFSEARY
jgi:hypothetical protein